MSIVRNSKQRNAIFSELKSRRDHPTADELYQSLKPDYPGLSLATVYRNLRQLCDEGLVKCITGAQSDHYDAFTEPHYHLCCKKCNRIYDLEMPYMPEIGEKAQSFYKGRIDTYTLMYKGVCEKCLSLTAQI